MCQCFHFSGNFSSIPDLVSRTTFFQSNPSHLQRGALCLSVGFEFAQVLAVREGFHIQSCTCFGNVTLMIATGGNHLWWGGAGAEAHMGDCRLCPWTSAFLWRLALSLCILMPLASTISGTSIPQSNPVTGAPDLLLQLLMAALSKLGKLFKKYPSDSYDQTSSGSPGNFHPNTPPPPITPSTM